MDILKLLKKIPINLETLQKTHIGMSVNNVRKQTKNDEVASTAKQLIKSWKKLVSGKLKSCVLVFSEFCCIVSKEKLKYKIIIILAVLSQSV